MSRTFELLQRLEKEQATGAPSVLPTNGHRSALPAPVGEEVSRLVQQVFRGPVTNERPRVVVFSSVVHGDGCSWVCANTALTLAAQNAGSICLVDANLRTPSLHTRFEIDDRVGLTDAMVQPAPVREFTQQIAGSHLWVLPAGSASGAHAQLNFETLRVRLTELCAEFDTILIDAPPASLYSDAAQIGRLADGVVLVLQSNTTRRESALKVKEIFEAASVRLLGAVLNKRTFPIPEKLYSRL